MPALQLQGRGEMLPNFLAEPDLTTRSPMSYFRRETEQSKHLVDRLPVYIFPAFVGSGRMLLGMALAGVTTAILLHSRAAAEPTFWWLGMVAYMASVVLVVSGIYAVNVIPPHESILLQPERELRPPAPGRPLVEEPRPAPPAAKAPEHRQSLLTDLLVDQWRLITKEQLRQALVRQANSGRSLVHELARMGLLTDEDLERVLTVQAAAQDPWHDAPRHD
jgi:hypothetical protein